MTIDPTRAATDPEWIAFWADHDATFGPLYAAYEAERARMYRAAGAVPPWLQSEPACQDCGERGIVAGAPCDCGDWPAEP